MAYSPSYDASPATDSPSGLLGAFSQTTFDDAAPAQKRLFLEALAAVDNPLVHGPDTVACVACHARTRRRPSRALRPGDSRPPRGSTRGRWLADLLGKNPATTVVVIDEVDTDNWGIGGETVTTRRARST